MNKHYCVTYKTEQFRAEVMEEVAVKVAVMHGL